MSNRIAPVCGHQTAGKLSRGMCLPCYKNEWKKVWRKNNPTQAKESDKSERDRYRERRNAYSRQYRRDHPDIVKACNKRAEIKRRAKRDEAGSNGLPLPGDIAIYGISKDLYVSLLTKQGGVCAICKRAPEKGIRGARRLAVDHDHASGVVRGLLCRRCNVLLGFAEDSQERLFSAANYLDGWQ